MMDIDVLQLAKMEMVTGSCIVVYMRYLFDILKQSKMEDMIWYIVPTTVGADTSLTSRDNAIKNRLISAKDDQMFLMPYYANQHWMLMLIHPHNKVVYFMDPASSAISKFNDHLNKKGNLKAKWKNLRGIPHQLYGIQCGYYVMRLMRDIIHDKELEFSTKWEKRYRCGNEYTRKEIDLVRDEIASYLLKSHVKL